NPSNGVVIFYNLKQKPDSAVTVKLTFMTPEGQKIVSFSNIPKDKSNKSTEDENNFYGTEKGSQTLSGKAGMNRFVWNLEYPKVKDPVSTVLGSSGGTLRGPKVVPGTYKVKLQVGDWSMTQPFQVKKDPRIEATQADLQAQ